MWDPYTSFESVILPNGLTLYASHWLDRPWQHMSFLIHSGANHDIPGTEGTAHFMEHVVSQNSIVSQQEMERFFQGHGGNADFGATSYPYTFYNFSLPAQDEILAQGLDMFGSMLLSAQLERCIERERQVIFGEFRQYYPADYLHELEVRKNLSLHPGHALERMALPLGTLESIARITQADLQRYYDTHYTPANMSVVAVGGKSLNELVQLLTGSAFGISKVGARSAHPGFIREVQQPLESQYRYRQSDYVSTPIEVGEYSSTGKLPGSISQSAVMIFSRALSERLFEEVRLRRAWTYNIDARPIPFISFYEYEIQAKGVVLGALNDIESVINECIRGIGEDEKLYERIKQASLAAIPMRDDNGEHVCAESMYSLAGHGHIRSYADESAELQGVQFSDMQKLSELLAPHMRHTQLAMP